jgi:trk system potassium uptake protein TrkA
LVTLLKLNRGQAALVELCLPDTSPCRGKAIRDVALPAGSVIASIIRKGQLVIPRGDTTLEKEDEILAVCAVEAEKPLKDALVGPA